MVNELFILTVGFTSYTVEVIGLRGTRNTETKSTFTTFRVLERTDLVIQMYEESVSQLTVRGFKDTPKRRWRNICKHNLIVDTENDKRRLF